MPFTNLNKRLDQERKHFNSLNRKKTSKRKKVFKIIVVLLILFLAIYLPLRGVYSSIRQINTSAKATAEAFKQENFDGVKNGVNDIKKANDGLNLSLGFLVWTGFIPYFGGFYWDAKHFSQAASYDLEAAQEILETLEPSKAELGFNGTPTPGQDKVAQFVKILDKVIPQLDKIQPQLQKAAKEVESIDVNKYPEQIGRYRVRSLVDTAKNFIGGASYAVTEAKPALEVAPSALGEPTAKNYLLIFQNDKEIRATGGFMTAYAFLRLDKGRVTASASDDIYRLDEKLLKVCETRICPLTPPAPIVKYLPEANGKPRTAWSMRDSNLSPDVPTSMQNFEKMYNLLGDGQVFDGIILIDTVVVEELIKITGPIEVFGTTYSADIDERCNCPNVVYELENYAQIIEKGEQDRKAILGTLMQQILARSLGSATEKLPEFINAGVKLANGKHLIFYMKDPATEEALAKLNWTGQIKPFNGDYLHINDSNFAGGKSNMYVEQNVTMDINVNDKGVITDKVTIEYSNPQKFNSWLNGINRDYVRLYVPLGSRLTNSKGSDVAVTTIPDELGKTVFESFIQVRPQNTRTLEFEYELPTSDFGNELPVLIQKQPGAKNFNYIIKVNGRKVQEFKLDSDKEFKFKI